MLTAGFTRRTATDKPLGCQTQGLWYSVSGLRWLDLRQVDLRQVDLRAVGMSELGWHQFGAASIRLTSVWVV